MGTITKETENVQVFYQILVYNINKKHLSPAILYIQFHSPLGVLILGYLAQILIICGSQCNCLWNLELISFPPT